MCASSARATRQPRATSSSSTSVSAGGALALTRIETKDGSSLVRPMRNSSTSNAASWRTTVSNIAFISCESIRWPSASTTSVTAAWDVMRGRPISMGHRINHDVDAERVAVRREAIEVFLALALALPRVRDVGIVRHDDQQPAAGVLDAAEVHVRAVVHVAALRDAAGLH